MTPSETVGDLPLACQQQIDAHCDKFEAAWKAGGAPCMEEYIDGVGDAGRPRLLQELLAIELQYRRDSAGNAVSDQYLLEQHPRLRPELSQQLHGLRTTVASRSLAGTPPSCADRRELTVNATPRESDTFGLHIRCPHCHNQVELVDETMMDNLTCGTCGSTFTLVGDEDEVQTQVAMGTIGRFEILSRLGTGGFGSVWKARDLDLQRLVAVKVPRKGRLARSEAELFFREARTAAQLRHPHIVPIHEVGRDLATGTVFIVSDLVQGDSLLGRMTDRPLAPHEAADLGAIIADALHYAHQQGIVHRDLKPSNVMIDQQGRPHVMDFGLAKREVGEITMTMDGHILGTPAYMSPEQARGQAHWTDRRTDVYSLGVMLFEMATGDLPYRGNAQMQLQQKLNADAPDPRKLNAHIPRDFATISLKCLERDPSRRYSSALDVANELRRYLRGEPVHARSISRMERAWRWSKRNPLAAAVLALVTFVAVAGPMAAAVIYSQRNELLVRYNERGEYMQRQIAKNRRLQADIAELENEKQAFVTEQPAVMQAAPNARRNLISEFLDKHYETTVAKLPDANNDPDGLARARLALAMMLAEVGRTTDAIPHLQSAGPLLAQLSEEQPDKLQYRAALADCRAQLGRLHYLTGEIELARKQTEQALAIRQQLAQLGKGNPRYHIDYAISSLDLYDVERGLIARAPEDTRLSAMKAKLLKTHEIKQAIDENWSTEPAALYDLACYLTFRSPMLNERMKREPTEQE